MGPITYTTHGELPVEKADRPGRNESAMRGEQNRRGERRRRQRESKPEPDADWFAHREPSEE